MRYLVMKEPMKLSSTSFNEFGCLPYCIYLENLHKRDFSGVMGQSVKLSTNPDRVPKIYMRGALPVLPLYAFLTHLGTRAS
jgi:hypothetical protein